MFHYFSVSITDFEFTHHLFDVSLSKNANVALLSIIATVLTSHLNHLQNGEDLTAVSIAIKNILASPYLTIELSSNQKYLYIDSTLYYTIDVFYHGVNHIADPPLYQISFDHLYTERNLEVFENVKPPDMVYLEYQGYFSMFCFFYSRLLTPYVSEVMVS